MRLNDGRSFSCRSDQTVLHAALAAGIDMPYECASGSCGSCRCRLSHGSVSLLWPEAPGLSARDRQKGDRILACQSTPSSDLEINVRAGDALLEPPPRRHAARVTVKETLCASVIRLVLNVGGPIHFLPGQFFILDLPGAGRRAYSVANLENAAGGIELLIKRKIGGAGTAALFDQCAPGMGLVIEGPYGRAYLRADSARGIVAVAGGSGLAPMLSILRGALARGFGGPMDLYFGVNTAEELFCVPELSALQAAGARVHLALRDGGPGPAGLHRQAGLIGDALVAGEPDLKAKDLYVAGPAPMTDDILARTVRQEAIPADRVFFDRFV
uniref:Alkene monooxygenase system, ferredoxin--NAD(+) reductase component n=1 Tax=Xanthobacter autotrophicus (strain ATCC BAA-1158 / Py2) TaxID=78245 RepID=XAMOF_XANP2|nr:RecName: Full=Alkene monooxygenase system, ferredoxin--NAD(+) reductase component; AltName: Full=Alkene monooxygenase 35.5 kDa subunit; AltName: Full=Alkene monooxygenase system, electron transfer component; AltName: Full=Ferredoxin--NAD(+) reductase [Xanthobacter autotrophicus Py2]CAA09916.1 reductase [Xanthobacter autotrophicus Py2]